MAYTPTNAACPYCAKPHTAAVGLTTDDTPKPGDIVVCCHCGTPSVYTADMQLRKPNAMERTVIIPGVAPQVTLVREHFGADGQPSSFMRRLLNRIVK